MELYNLDGSVTITDDSIPGREPLVLQQNDPQFAAKVEAFLGEPRLPELVPMYKILKYLTKTRHDSGVDWKATIEGAIKAMQNHSNPQIRKAGDMAWDDWTRADNFVTYSALVQNLKGSIGMSEAQFRAMVLGAHSLP